MSRAARPLLLAALAAVVALPVAACGSSSSEHSRRTPARLLATSSKLPLAFVENEGQADRRARFYLQGRASSVFFTRHGLALSLSGSGDAAPRWGLKLDFLHSRAGAAPIGQARTDTTVSYFRGRPGNGKAGVPVYGGVAYRNLWPGVDLIYTGDQRRLKYSLRVRPGADPGAIDLAWRGATALRVDRRGRLEIAAGPHRLRDDTPVAYQVMHGRRVPVSSSYALGHEHSYGFRVGRYDRRRPLVIDPAVLVYAGYLGGAKDDGANNIALDGKGNVYVSGTTTSTAATFPDVVGPDRSFGGGSDDAFVAKVNPSGTRLLYAGYIGGSGRENGIDLVVDGHGAAYLSGSTGSTNFPATRGAADTTYNGGDDGFVAKVDPSGRRLDYATYIGGAGGEQANNVAVDRSGSAYVTGFTGSDQGTFPNGRGFAGIRGFDRTFNSFMPGIPDAFVVKLNASGRGFDYASYIGGGGGDGGTAIAVDRSGSAYVGGTTTSNQNPPGPMNPVGGFPARIGPDLTYNGTPGPPPRPGDAFLAKVNPSGSALDYAGYVGGAGNDKVFGVAVDRSGEAYATGETTSTQATFPGGNGFGSLAGFDKTFNGASNRGPTPGPTAVGDAFVVKVNRSGSGFAYATFIGGRGDEGAIPITLDRAGSAYIAGTTRSTQATFPVRNGPDSTYNGGLTDAFVAKLNPSGRSLDFAGYIGGSLAENGIGVAVDQAGGNVYVAGTTESSQRRGFPVRVGPDTTFNGRFNDTDAFVAKLTTHPPTCLGQAATRIGTAGVDTIIGTRGRDVIVGLGGNDTIRGLGGNDVICGGPGNDRISGGNGSDRLSGESGNDRLSGDAGNDRLSGGSGNDRIDGGAGRDRCSRGSGRDRLSSC